MISLGLRLAVASGREAVTRLVIIAAAVAVGVTLLLTTLAGVNGVGTQNARYAWLNSGSVQGVARSPDPLWWLLRADSFDRQNIGRFDVAATGPDSPVPPGIPRLPGPGEFYASPELTKLLNATPADQLADRYPGRQVGTIGDAALPAPNSLIIIIGHPPDELARVPGAVQVRGILTTAPDRCDGDCIVGVKAAGMDLLLSVVAAGLIFPVLMFIGTATRLAAARREQRFAAMRLVGATPRQISVISAVEATVSALAGAAAGFGLFVLFRAPLAAIPFTGAPFFPSDLSLTAADVVSVALGVPAAAALVARAALRRVRISPLGVTRRVTPRPPRAYRLIPLVAGLAELAYFVGRRPETTDGQVRAFLPGFLVVLVGLVVAGPWLTMMGARLLARYTRRPAALIAARRLADNPRAGFRAVSGLVLALFVTSVAVGVIGTIVAHRGAPTGGARSSNLTMQFWPKLMPSADVVPAGLTSKPGVKAAAVVHQAPRNLWPADNGGPLPRSLALCADIARSPDFGRCAPGAIVAWVFSDLLPFDATAPDAPVWPAASLSPDEVAQLPVESLVVATDGTRSTLERMRTVLEAAFPSVRVPRTDADLTGNSANLLSEWKQLANVVILVSLAIAGCSLAVSVTGGLTDRKRPFSMLRLTGVPLRMLRRVVTLESVTPLLAAAVVATGTGFLAAHLFLKAQMGYALSPPTLAYYATVLAGLVASLGIIAATMPLLRRITGPETARNE